MRTYVGTLDDGLGDADFLDELIPVEDWATNGQRNSRSEPPVSEQANGGIAPSGRGVE